MFPRIRQTSYHYTVLCCCIFVTSAILSGRGSDFGISNVSTGVSGGGHAFYLEDGSSLLAASGTFFIGGFSSTYSSSADISTAFTTDFSSLAADFISIGSVGVEVDDIGPFDGLHNSVSTVDTSSVVGRNVAVWLSSTNSFSDANAEHLIYWFDTTLYVADDPPPDPQTNYDVLLRPGEAGDLVVGEFGNFTYNFGFGEGDQLAFNTVAVPEPSAVFSLLSLCAIGFIINRRRCRSKSAR